MQAPPERVFTGQAVGVITLRDLTMTSGAQGYALGAIQQSTVIAETADGGATWSAVGLSLPDLLPGDRTTVVGFGQPGGLAGPVGLFELNPLTSKVAFQGELLDANWARGARLGSARIMRVDSSLAYAFVSKQKSSGFGGALVETTNSGSSWTPLGDPCGGMDFEVRLSAPSPGVVWMGCGSVPSTGNQLKAVYRSDDAGASWLKVWDGVVSQGKTIMEGYMSSLVAVNSMQAYIGLGRGPLLQTFDGGATWMTAVPEIGGSGGVEDVDALSSEQAWAVIGGGRMWRTTDGTSWSQVRSAG
ncbi:MAG: WD40/YVTN/BNR-like repeat-containing protein [Acidimicrobiales bacterium]